MVVLMSPDTRVPKDQSIPRIEKIADEALLKMSPLFDEMDSTVGRPSIPPDAAAAEGDAAHGALHVSHRAAVLRAAAIERA